MVAPNHRQRPHQRQQPATESGLKICCVYLSIIIIDGGAGIDIKEWLQIPQHTMPSLIYLH